MGHPFYFVAQAETFLNDVIINDVIIDFYLKYIQYSVLPPADRDR
jgi:Ulp1 family protease